MILDVRRMSTNEYLKYNSKQNPRFEATMFDLCNVQSINLIEVHVNIQTMRSETLICLLFLLPVHIWNS